MFRVRALARARIRVRSPRARVRECVCVCVLQRLNMRVHTRARASYASLRRHRRASSIDTFRVAAARSLARLAGVQHRIARCHSTL